MHLVLVTEHCPLAFHQRISALSFRSSGAMMMKSTVKSLAYETAVQRCAYDLRCLSHQTLCYACLMRPTCSRYLHSPDRRHVLSDAER